MFKSLVACTLAAASLTTSYAEQYLLDKKGFVGPVGTRLESTMSTEMNDLKLDILGLPEPTVMMGLEKSSKQTFVEVTSPNSYRTTIAIHKKVSESRMNGKLMPADLKKANPLLTTPVIYSFANKEWSAKGEKANLTPEQLKKVNHKLAQMNSEESLYTYKPKKVGDKWEVDLAKIGFGFLEEEDAPFAGNAKVSFLSVEMLKGHKCAKLKVVLKAQGRAGMDDNAPEMSMQGTVIVFRSIEFMVDMEATGSLRMGIKTKNGPITLTGGGTTSIIERVTINK